LIKRPLPISYKTRPAQMLSRYRPVL
jgi:hypothetical protein